MTNPFVIEENPKKIRDSKILNYNHKLGGDVFGLNEESDALKVTISHKRIAIFFIALLIIISVFAVRLFYLQIINKNYWLKIAEENRIKIEKQTPLRGIIYDRNNNPLVENKPNFVLSVVPSDLNYEGGIDDFYNSMTDLFGKINIDEIRQKMEKVDMLSQDDIEIKSEIQYNAAIDLMLKIQKYPFLRLNSLSLRRYLPKEWGLSHVLGYLGKINSDEWNENLKEKNYQLIDLVGKSGLEKEYEQILRGEAGLKYYEVDAIQNIQKTISKKDPVPGKNLILTIDSKLNHFFAEKLCSQADKFDGEAAGITINPKNGEILAIVSCPYFDDNEFISPEKFEKKLEKILNDEKKPLYNRAIQGEYPPGSIFKLIISSAGLQEGIINKNTLINSTGGISIGKWFFPDWKAGGHGIVNLTKAIAESVNTFFYYVGGGFGNDFIGLGMERIVNYAEKFNLNQKTGIDLGGESKGFLPSKEWKEKNAGREWYIGDTYHLSIGQGDLTVTPLQIALITSFFANQGTIYKPHLIKAFLDLKNIKTEIKPEVLSSNIIDSEYVDEVKKGLLEAVVSGSSSHLKDLPFQVAGKTGTAQVSGDKLPHAWFTGFAPYENPEIVITVLIENGGEGSATAVPVAKEVLRWYFLNKLQK